MTKLLDKEHPSKYIESAGQLLKESKLNDAAFIYYLGILRYKYFNSTNPEYQTSGDRALLASLQYVFNEIIEFYLKTNIGNYILILKSSGDLYAENDYVFYPQKIT